MQELTRTRRNKAADAETFGKRKRTLLNTLYMVGQYTNKTYFIVCFVSFHKDGN